MVMTTGIEEFTTAPSSRLALFLALALALGCTTQQKQGAKDVAVIQGGLPGARASAEITDLGEKVGYLDASVKTGGREYRFFFPPTQPCRELLSGDANVQYGTTGRGGFLVAGELRCEPAGVLNLAQWRAKGGRRAGEGIVRAQATYEVYERADGYALARGRFPMVSRLGIGQGYAVGAILPDTEACSEVLNSTTASMEYRQTGKAPIMLLAGSTPCEMVGVLYEPENTSSEPSE
jgi:hypothetical protein